MTRVYRILRKPYAKQPFDGESAYRFGGRWSSPGVRVAYAAEHVSLAILEYLVHVDPEHPPGDLVLVEAEIPDSITKLSIEIARLPPDWRNTPPPATLAAVGDQFVANGELALLTVPSVLAPTESNWLLNPAHSAFAKIRVKPPQTFQYDSRFFVGPALPGGRSSK